MNNKIKEGIEVSKNLLDTLPKNKIKNKNKYKEALNETVEKYQNLLKEYPTTIRKYISENGEILPVMVTLADKECLKNMYFNLSDSQIDNILFFCQVWMQRYDTHNPQIKFTLVHTPVAGKSIPRTRY